MDAITGWGVWYNVGQTHRHNKWMKEQAERLEAATSYDTWVKGWYSGQAALVRALRAGELDLDDIDVEDLDQKGGTG